MVIWAWNDKIILSSFYDGKSILIGINYYRIQRKLFICSNFDKFDYRI